MVWLHTVDSWKVNTNLIQFEKFKIKYFESSLQSPDQEDKSWKSRINSNLFVDDLLTTGLSSLVPVIHVDRILVSVRHS